MVTVRHLKVGVKKICPGKGVLKAKFLEEAKLELFPGGRRGAKQKTFHGESMDISWNYMHI